jgi:hypothetical protein
MPKPILRQQQQTQQESVLSATRNQQQETQQKEQAQQMDKMKLDRLLRQPRSKAYMDAIHKLDAGGHVHNQHKVDEIINIIKSEFPEVELAGVLLGYVSKCYLGNPYEVHTLDITGNIIEHYQAGNTLPGGLEKARSIAIRGGYEFIEVYVDCCRAVSGNGSVSVISM